MSIVLLAREDVYLVVCRTEVAGQLLLEGRTHCLILILDNQSVAGNIFLWRGFWQSDAPAIEAGTLQRVFCAHDHLDKALREPPPRHRAFTDSFGSPPGVSESAPKD